jgi:predicted RNase H-like HicB family nuclease
MKSHKAFIRVQIFIKKDGEGYHAFCPALEGLHVGGNTLEEVKQNAKDAVEAYLLSLIKHDEPIPLGDIIAKPTINQCISDYFNLKHYTENYVLAAI